MPTLVGKLVNIAKFARPAFIHKFGEGRLADQLARSGPVNSALSVDEHEAIADEFENRNFQMAIRPRIMALADEANRYIDEHKPWVLAKEAGREQEVLAICTQGINLFRAMMIWLNPVIPHTAAAAAEFLDCSLDDFNSIDQPLLGHTIKPFKSLLRRVEPEQIERVLTASRESLEKSDAPEPASDQKASLQENDVIGGFPSLPGLTFA